MISSKYFKQILVLFAVLIYISSCRVDRIGGINRLNNQQFARKAQKTGYVLLDVRTPAEYDSAHIAGSILMNLKDSLSFIEDLTKLDPSKKYLIYCRSGVRSLKASRALKASGIKKVNDLAGGFKNWTGASDSTFKK